MDIWNEVCETDPSETKKVNQRGGFTAIDPTYQAQKATEQFGPYGIGWGLGESEFDYAMLDSVGLVIHKAVFFYLKDDVRGSFPITNAISIYSDKNKTRVDEDFAKKVETNTISKALSRLGFSADVFLGKFDDYNYVEVAKQKEFIKKSIDQQEAYDEANRKFADWAKREIDAYDRIPKTGLGAGHRANLKKLNLKLTAVPGADPARWNQRFEDAYTNAMKKFETNEK